MMTSVPRNMRLMCATHESPADRVSWLLRETRDETQCYRRVSAALRLARGGEGNAVSREKRTGRRIAEYPKGIARDIERYRETSREERKRNFAKTKKKRETRRRQKDRTREQKRAREQRGLT